jgi:hypothetical protein
MNNVGSMSALVTGPVFRFADCPNDQVRAAPPGFTPQQTSSV